MVNRDIDHIHMNVCIGTVAVSISAVFAVLFGLIQILFFHNLFALDHTAAAVGTAVFALFTDGAAAGAVVIILDLGADDLLLRFRIR